MEKFDIDKIRYSELKKRVEIPEFQRTYVWSNQKKIDLINTIKKRLPIGTLLLSQNGNKYRIIDGLQRISTLKDYEKDPCSYLEEAQVTDDIIMKMWAIDKDSLEFFEGLSKKKRQTYIKKLKSIIIQEMKENSHKDDFERIDIITDLILREIVTLHHENLDHYKAINRIVSKLIEEIEEILDIDNYEIPVIIFKGRDEELVEVFTLLNTKGTKLSKYDVFAAKWSAINIEPIDDEILEVLIKKYKKTISKTGIEIEGFSEEKFRKKSKVTLFEYAFAIGKLLGKKTKYIFNHKDDDKVDSLGFSILTGIFNISNKEMNKLSKKMPDFQVDYADLKKKIINSAKEIEDVLEKYIGHRRQNFACHSEFQLASYIVTYFRLCYLIDEDTNKIVRNSKNNYKLKDFKKFLPSHYFYDVYRQAWRGSGDSKFDSLIIDEEGMNFNSTILESPYLFRVEKSELRRTIENWINEENKKDKTNVSREVRLFLNCIFSNRNIARKYSNSDFDHIVPKKKLKRLSDNPSIRVAVSSPCNITLIPQYDNRSKGDRTYYEVEDSGGVNKKYNRETLDILLYPKKDELSFAHYKKVDLKDYNDFLKRRKNIVIDAFIEALYN